MRKYLQFIVFSLLLSPFQLLLAEQGFSEIYSQAMLSNDAYLSLDELELALSEQHQVLLHKATIQSSQVNYFISEAAGVQTIGVRGTANLENVMLDLSVSLQSDSLLNIKLHQGFSGGAKAVYDDIKPYLSIDKPIHLTGHSLGGAIAVVLGMYLTQEGYQVEQVITFGQPKVTNVTGAEQFKTLPLIRVVTPHDIVPLVPPLSPLQIKELDIYWHMGAEVILMEGGKYSETSGIKSAMRATKFTSSIPSEKNLVAHKMTTYLMLIDTLRESSEEVPYKTEISLFGFSLD
ncbi:lipase family protein [Marinomonas sp. 2405UD66-6]|uniref:lipase family protein n=1 Tax=Marinomonas sp. 2405UD66-6 TaxID=3391834 RepID=UPI0039C8D5D0